MHNKPYNDLLTTITLQMMNAIGPEKAKRNYFISGGIISIALIILYGNIKLHEKQIYQMLCKHWTHVLIPSNT